MKFLYYFKTFGRVYVNPDDVSGSKIPNTLLLICSFQLMLSCCLCVGNILSGEE